LGFDAALPNVGRCVSYTRKRFYENGRYRT
jgi:hypothetical protein